MSGSPSDTPSTTHQTTQTQLPGYAQPYATNILERGYGLSTTPFQQYGGQRVADLTPEQQAGLNMTTQRALQGSPELNASRNMIGATAAGDYLHPDSNPYLQATVDRALGDVKGQVNSQFNSAGGYGGTAHQETLQRGMSEAALNAYGQNYQGERLNQLRASQQAPGMAQADYTDAQALMGAGDVYGQRQQQLLNTQYGDWQQAQEYPYRQLDVLGNALTRSIGGQGTVTQTGSDPNVQFNPTAGAIAGGAAGYGLGSMAQNQFGSYSPYIGAALGALGGYNAY